MKFKNGDIVIGNEKADKLYFITKKGYIGKIVNIVVRNENDGLIFTVIPDCFDLLDPPKEISEKEEAEFAAMIF